MKVTVNSTTGNRVSINNDKRELVRTLVVGAGDDGGIELGIAGTAFNKANAANSVGEAGLIHANGAYAFANSTYTYAANTVQLIANSAYNQANLANLLAKSGYDQANAAYDQANATSFLRLTDTPNSFVGLANSFVAVNETEDGLILVDTISIDSLIHTVDAAPTSVEDNTLVVYMTGTGISPNRELRYCIKYENEEEVILSSIIV